MAECDALDGLVDGILNDPRRCNFDVESLACSKKSSNECLAPEQIAAASPKVTAEIKDFVADAELASQHRIERIPAIAVLGERDHGIRFYGVPSGYEFAALVEAVIGVGGAAEALPEEAVKALRRLPGPAHLQVYVSPT